MKSARGKVAIVGAGPGDPDLITLKGLKYIEKADVILYDRLAPKELLKSAKREAELIYVGKEPGKHVYTQDEINMLLYKKAIEGKFVVRLKGGDPFIFGRGEEECLFLVKRGIDCEVVPGVPSFVGASAYAGIPLTNRWLSSSFVVVTGTEAPEKGKRKVVMEKIASCADTLVILMGVRNLSDILEEIMKVRGPNERAAIVINATKGDQKVVTGNVDHLKRLAEAKAFTNPAVIIVGNVVRLRDDGLWRAAKS